MNVRAGCDALAVFGIADVVGDVEILEDRSLGNSGTEDDYPHAGSSIMIRLLKRIIGFVIESTLRNRKMNKSFISNIKLTENERLKLTTACFVVE